MADFNEQLGQNVEEAIESREDEISKHGGVTVSLEDFFSRAFEPNPISEEDEKLLRKNLEDEYDFNNTQIDQIVETAYDFNQGSIDVNTISQVDTVITDIELQDSFNTDTAITQTNPFELNITPIAQEGTIEETAEETTATAETESLTTETADTEDDTTQAPLSETPTDNNDNTDTQTDNPITSPEPGETPPSTGDDNNGSNVTVTIEETPDTSALAPTISVEDAGVDGIYNSEELGEDGTVTATISLPSDAAAGDTLTINGNSTVLTEAQITAGEVTTEVAPGSTVTATITDAAGNTSDQASTTVAGSDTSVTAPTITMESTGTDSVYNSEELGEDGTVTATISLPSDAAAGDTLTINGNSTVLTEAQITAGEVTTEVAPGSTVTATITDAAGNTSDQASTTVAGSDTSVTAPTITMESTGTDSVYNSEELGEDGTVTATISLPSDAAAGDTLTINGNSTVLTEAQITAGEVTTEVAPGSTVTATITDAAGNTSDQASTTVAGSDTSVTAPTITMESTGTDSVYNSEELGEDGTVTATISLPSDAAAGDTLTINGNSTVLTEAQITAGEVTTEVAPGSTVTATITDAAGNTSDQASTTVAGSDTSVTAPTITMESTGTDSVYNSEELGEDGTVTATISLPSDAAAGDTLTINGNSTVLTEAQITAGEVTTEVAPGSTVTATITDAAGNTSDQASTTVAGSDTSVTAPTITMESTGTDSVYNSEELGEDGTVTATISLPSDAAAGDTLTINGNSTVLTEAQITAGEVTTEVAPGSTVTATITDAAGNTSDQASTTVAGSDTSVTAPTITMESTGTDSVYNSEELGEDGTVTATISLPSDAAAGDTLTINGNSTVLTEAQITAGEVTTEVAPGSTVTATITDAAGNTSDQASTTVAGSDTSVTAPTITMESTGTDSVYNSEELGEDGTVTATISLPSDAAAGDTLTINGNSTVLTEAQITAGEVTTEVAPGSTVTATITDAAGNTSDQASTTVAGSDTSVTAPTITMESTGTDSVYNSEELGEDGTVTATISLPSDAAAGDTLTINGNSTVLTEAQITAGEVTTEVAPGSTVTATITDAAGNTSDQASTTVAGSDTSVTAPTITMESTGTDSVYNSEELGEDGTVTATISLPSDAAAGDTLTINGNSTVLTEAQITAGEVTTEVAPGSTVTATITDAAGNTSDQASTTVAGSDTSVTAPTITMESTGTDSVYNSEELGEDGTVTATISLPSDAAAGDTLTINGNSTVLTEAQITAGEVTTEVAPGSTVTATITDAAGNTSDQASTTVAGSDTSVTAPTITMESTGTDSVYNSEELGEDGTVTATISLPSDAAAGDTLTINGNSTVLTEAQITAGEVTTEVAPGSTVTATITDAAGNTSDQASTTVAGSDTSVTAPTITMESTGTDSVYNSEELGEDGTVTATISLPSDAAAGDTLTINGNSTVLTEAQITAGEVTTEVAPGSTVTATITDAAGNTSDQASTTVAGSDTSVTAPTITMESTGTDSVYNSEELGEDGTVTATISLPSDAAAGDTLTINGNSTVLTEAQITAGEVTTEVAPGSTVTATITDAAGNTSDQASTTVAGSDTSVTAPTITMESTGTDSVYNSEELGEDGTVTATISLPSDAAAGDTLTINGNSTVLTEAQITAGEVTTEVAPGSTVTATITDAAGNTSDQASTTVAGSDTSVTAPTITMESTGTDSVYNSEELGEDGTVTATISLPSDAAAGDTLTINGNSTVLTEAQITAGEVTTEVAPGSTVTATITDAAGNTSDQASTTVAGSDTSVTAPTITMESTGTDSVYNSEELGEDGTVTATISLPSDAAAGDTLTINGNSTVLTEAQITAGEVTTEVAPGSTVTATITDAAGNTSDQASTTVAGSDTSVTAPTITMESTGTDSVYNSEELGEDGTVTATISLPSDAAAGDTLTINGNSTVLTEAQITAGEVTTEVAPGSTVTATITDAAGNTSDQASTTVAGSDTSVTAPTITMESTGTDSVYNSEELGEDGTVTATISLPSDAAAGDTLTINGNSTVLTEAQITAGEVTTEVAPGSTVTATITDAAGNTSDQASTTVAGSDTSVTAPTITMESTGTDSVYNSEELGEDGTVTATISLPSDAAAGDTLTINGNSTVLTEAQITAGEVTTEVAPGSTVTATITDAAGNTSDQASTTVAGSDTSVTAPTITMESTGTDSVYNSEELGEDGTVTATISLPSDAAAGDTLTINGNSTVLTEAQITAGEVTTEVAPGSTVTATITDAAGNTSDQASTTVAGSDTSVTAPTITMESTGTDSVYNSEELGEDGTVTATISLPSDAAAGDTLTINGNSTVLTEAQITAGEVTTEVAPGSTVTATITDAAGNTSDQASTTVAGSDTSVTAPTITMESTGTDSVYNSEELGEDGTVTATISLPSDAAAGDTLTINGNSTVLTEAQITAGEVTTEVAPGSTVTATITDAAGNTSDQASTTVAGSDTSVTAPTITMESTGTDSVYNSEELGEDGTVTATISLPSDAAAGDTLTINGNSTVLTEAQITAGEVTTEVAPGSTVTATITDAAGNTSDQASTTVAGSDTSVTAPTITMESTGTDSVYNSEELGEDGTVTATISLPSDAAAGDTLTINGNSTVLTEAQITAGEVTTEVAPGSTVTATITDAAGNTSDQASTTVAGSDTSVTAPTITMESTGTDSVYNSEELGEDGTVTATISLPSDAAAGDTLTINGNSTVLTEAQITAGEVTTEVAPGSTVTATITDAAGNTSDQASTTVAGSDTSVTAPTITMESTGTDSVYNSEELGEDGTVTATISLPSDAAAGDTLTINGNSTVLTEAQITAGEVTTEVAPGSTVTATITDAAGNTSDQASTTVAGSDTSVTAPTITMESTGTDSVYNSEELGEDGTVTATISLPSDAAAGDTLTINGNSTVLTEAQITAGEVTTEVAPGSTVTATITDAAGNTSDQASTTVAGSDTSVTAPTITMESTGTDSVYNSEELGEDGTVTATISLPSDAAAGDTLTINGNSTVLTEAQITAGEVTTEVAPGSTVTATITDAAGNTSDQASTTVAGSDTSVTAPTITMESTGTDSVYNSEELGEDGTVTATISLPSDAAAGDTLTINGNSTVLTEAQITAGEVTTEVAPGSTVTATITDAAGNTSDQASTTVAGSDTSVTAPTITMESTGTDSVYNSEELGEDGTVTATISLPSDAAAGDTLTINGNSTVLTEAQITAGEVTTEVAPGSTVTATITDAAGNTSDQASTTVAGSDTSVTAPTITMESTGTDSVYNSEELGEDGTVTATISLPSDAAAGDTLTINGNSTVLTEAQITAGEVTTEVAPGSTVTATITDAAGNTSDQASTTVAGSDTSVTAPTITMESTGTDSVYNSEELGEDGTVTATISLPSDAAAGDTLTINGNSTVLTEAQITAGEVTTEVAPGSTVTATITDAAGNTSDQASTTVAGSDTSVTAPTITMESTGTDSVYNSEELGEDGTVTATISLPSDAAAGDTLTINGNSTVLTEAQITAGEVTTEVAPGSTVTATITDAAGNTSDQASTTVAGSDTSVTAPTITMESTGTDSVYNSEELGEDGTVTATISLPSDAAAGDTLTINGNSTVLTEAQITAGEVTTEVAPGSTVTATITDAAGNTSDQASTTVAGSDTSVTAPTITMESTGTDSVYNSEELGEDGTVTATISLPSDAAAGDTLTINGNSTVLTEAQITAGEVTTEVAPGSTVTATITDAAGNTSDQASTTVAGSDTSVTAPTITMESTGTDSVYNSEELGEDGTVTATISLPSDAAAGDTLTINGNSTVLTEAQITAGEVTTEVAPGSTVTATITDAAGNTSDQASTTVAGSDVSADEGTVTVNPITEDDVVNAAEAADTVTVTGTATGGDISTGDTVTTTINGNEYSSTVAADGSYSFEVAGSDLAADTEFTVNVASTDAAGNSVTSSADSTHTVDTSASDIGQLSISNIIDNSGDYSTVTMTGSGAEAGNTITIYDEDGNGVATAEVQPDGSWSADISNLDGTPVNDNEFFSISETDSAGNETAQTDTTHYAHFDWNNAETDNYDDFDIAGSGDDRLAINDNDLNDSLVVDGGEGNDTVVYSGNMSDYIIGTNTQGNVTVTENSSTDSDNDGIGDVTELRNVETIEFADGSYDISTGTFTSNDLVPTATDENIIVDLDSQTTETTSVDVSGGDGHQTTNLVVTLDLSGSMTNRSGTIELEDGSTTNRLELAKESLENLINEFDGVGDVNVNLTTFSDTGASYGWMSAEDAISFINNLSSGGSTNYEDAVHETASNYTDIPDADKTVALFVSDGEPTTGNDGWYDRNMLDDKYVQEWAGFVEDNVDQLLVVGMGTGITDTSYLETLAVEVGDVQVNMMVIENELELNEILIETLVNSENSVTGNLLDNVEGGDGTISLDAVEIDGVTYTADSFPSEGISTPEGATITIDFATGDYSYTASTLNFNSDVTESFNVTASDEDGDSITYGFNVTVDVDDEASLPVLDLEIGDVQVSEVDSPTMTQYENTDSNHISGSWDSAEYDLGGVTNSVDVTFENLRGQYSEEAKVELLDSNGNVVDTVVIQGDTGGSAETHTITSNSEFSSIRVSGGDWNDDFVVRGVSADVEVTDGNVINSANDWWTNNEVIEGTAADDIINVGTGDDKVINAGAGDDIIEAPVSSWNNFGTGHIINGGEGTDTLIINAPQDNGSVKYNIVDNGDGTTTISQVGYNQWGEWDLDHYEVTTENVENIQFSDGTVVLGTYSDDTLPIENLYSYDISLNTELTDTDGSESLSDITLTNIPDGASITGNAVTDNGDGTYTITPDENGSATVTLTSNTEVAQDDLNSITASISATEENGGDISTVSATDDSFMLGEGAFELDFDNIEDGALTDINSIDMGDSAHHIENIDVSDVMNMTGEDNTLTIFGEDDDVVSLDTDTWTKGEDIEVDGETFSTFTGGGDNGLEEVQLLIDTHVTVDQS